MDQSDMNIHMQSYKVDNAHLDHSSFGNAKRFLIISTLISLLGRKLSKQTSTFFSHHNCLPSSLSLSLSLSFGAEIPFFVVWSATNNNLFKLFSFMIQHRNYIETFKITHEYDRWHLHFHDRTVKTCDNLAELSKNIKTSSKQTFRLAPSEYGRVAYG